MFILYDIIFILVFLFWYLPEYLFKGKFHSGFLMRLGIFPRQIRQRLAGKQTIWLHAVSVGEVLAARELLEGLRKEYPQRQIVISTVTPTGNAVARKIAAPQDLVIYLPLDISFIAAAVVRRINPLLVIIAETELWPNLIGVLNRRKVPIITVNARISDGSFRGYGLIRFLIRPVLNKISFFCLQSETDARRLSALGASPEKLRVTGNKINDVKIRVFLICCLDILVCCLLLTRFNRKPRQTIIREMLIIGEDFFYSRHFYT